MSQAVRAQSPFNAELNDVWATPGENGWGIQIVEQGEVAFGTLFVNDAAGRPTFYWAFLAAGPGQTWSGDLIETYGPYFGMPYDPMLFSARLVGTLKFTRVTSNSATIDYSVDGTQVTRNIVRQLWRYTNYSGNYFAAMYIVTSHCSNADDNGERTAAYPVRIEQTGTVFTLTASFAKRGTSTCTYTGDYTQAGRVGAVGTNYTCSDGDEGNISFYELTKRGAIFAGRLQGHSITDSCDYSGAITGLVPQ